MNTKTTCSVAMAVYNGEKFIEKQLLSILNQTRPVDEVIICDDGSKDNTISIINNIIESHNLTNWHLHQNPTNIGARENFNKAIKKCSGDVIFFCDQDDVWENNKVEEIVKVFDENPDAKSVITNFKLIDENDNYIFNDDKLDNPWFNHKDYPTEKNNSLLYRVPLTTVLLQCVAPGCTQAIRKELTEALFNFDHYLLYHDAKINLIASAQDGLFYINKALTKYRIHSTNTVGIPKCAVRRRKKQYIYIPLYYIIHFINGARSLIKRTEVQQMFSLIPIMEQVDKLEMKDYLLPDYNYWKEYAINKDKLYSKEKHKYKYWKAQKKYWKPNKQYNTMKYRSYLADPIERYEKRVLDFVAMFKH